MPEYESPGHWVWISDEDLSFIEKYHPNRDKHSTWAELCDVIADIKDIIEDGLETGPLG